MHFDQLLPSFASFWKEQWQQSDLRGYSRHQMSASLAFGTSLNAGLLCLSLQLSVRPMAPLEEIADGRLGLTPPQRYSTAPHGPAGTHI